MRLRSFTADSMPDALALVKAELGEDAIILQTEESQHGVQITAAVDPDAAYQPTPTPPQKTTVHSSHRDLDALRYQVQYCLRFHQLPELFVSKMLGRCSDRMLQEALLQASKKKRAAASAPALLAMEALCRDFFRFTGPLPQPARLMLVGSSGIGKTMAVAKLATEYHLKKQPCSVITTDLERAGGADQLGAFTDILNLPLYRCADSKSLREALKKIPAHHAVLMDTPGCNPFDNAAIQRLREQAKIAHATCLLTVPAGLDAEEALEHTEAMISLPITQIVASRTDSAKRLGAALAIATAYDLPFSVYSAHPSVAHPMTPLTPSHLSELLTRHCSS